MRSCPYRKLCGAPKQERPVRGYVRIHHHWLGFPCSALLIGFHFSNDSRIYLTQKTRRLFLLPNVWVSGTATSTCTAAARSAPFSRSSHCGGSCEPPCPTYLRANRCRIEHGPSHPYICSWRLSHRSWSASFGDALRMAFALFTDVSRAVRAHT